MNAEELATCVDTFGTQIYRFCRKLCADQASAEDLYQQTFLKALESNLTLDWAQNPKALFFSLAHNLWKSERRKSARRAGIAPSSSLEEDEDTQLCSNENIEETVSRRELLHTVHRIIESLPEKIRIPLTLYYLFECSVEDIAKTVERPPGTIKSRLFKGRNIIKKRLEELGYGTQAI